MPSRREYAQDRNKSRLLRFWRSIRDLVVLLLAAVIVFFVVRTSLGYFIDTYLKPVDEYDAQPIEIIIPSKSSASTIARILNKCCGEDEPGLIHNTAIFKVYVDFLGKANNLKAGTYILSRNMTMKQIVDIICAGNQPKLTVKFTIPEGYTVEDIAGVLLQKGLITDTAVFLQTCKSGAGFENFDFIRQLQENGASRERDYLLEGYLFPDTYEVYVDASVDTILTKMLNRFNDIMLGDYQTRAEELGLTVDEVVRMASLIEREAQVEEDFKKVSSVFHNRIDESMPLQSCASLSYALRTKKYTFTAAELELDSPYNTYRYPGLPAGPIANPGKLAIEAALYPNEEYVEGKYLYFCNGNLTISNALLFSKTYEEHQRNVKEYQQYWK